MSIGTAPGPRSGWQGLFWNAFRQSKNGMILVDAERRIVETNGAWIRLLGYQRQSLLGRHVSELRATGPPASEQAWQAAMAQRQFSFRAELRRIDGTHVQVEIAGHPEMMTGKQLVLMVVLHAGRRAGLRAAAAPSKTRRGLTRREIDVVALVADGLSGPEIATELQLTHNTIRTHIRNAMAKTESRSRAELVAKALAEAMIWAQEE